MNREALDRSLEFIKSWLEFRSKRTEIPGYVAAVAYKGEILLNEAYGYADLEKRVELTSDHIFRIASQSKTFTATAVMQLVEKGKLGLDDYAVSYLPWLKNHKDKRWQKVTVRQLLSHGAGVIRDGANSDYWQLERPFPNANELKEAILDSDLIVNNNVKLKYSNYGYSLLGLIIEAVSGRTYSQYVTERIIKPLGLPNTGPEYTPAIKDKIVTGYTRRDVGKSRLPIEQIETRAMAPATGFYSNASDMCRYFTAHFVGSGKLLDDESKKEMQRVQWHAKAIGQSSHEDYGLGFDIDYPGKRQTIGHGGGFPGQSTKTMADPKDKLVVVVLTNCIDGPPSWIAKSIYGIIDYYQENTPNNKPKHDLKKFEGRYMDLWGIAEIIVTGDKIISVYPDSWDPISNPEELEYVDAKTLKVTSTSSFAAEDELVHFNIERGKVESVVYNGSTMWPEPAWIEKQKKRSMVRLKA